MAGISHYVYVLQSAKTGELYKGLTGDVRLRLEQHNSGLARSTKHGAPWRLVYLEECSSLKEAVRRERYLKTGKGREELRRILESKQSGS